MKRLIYIGLSVLLLLLGSCERRPLVDLNHTHYVRVYIDEALPNVTKGFYNESYARPHYQSPAVLRVALADVETGKVIAERYLRNKGRDEKGLYFDGYIDVAAGTYSLMAYNFDTETTMVAFSENRRYAKATTNEIASHLKANIPSRYSRGENGELIETDEKITYEPDHLFAANSEKLTVRHSEKVDTLLTEKGEYFTAQSIVRSYYMQVRVKGMQYASSSVGLLTGLSGSSWVNGQGMDLEDPITVYFEMVNNLTAGITKNASEDDVVTLYTTFSTFGKLPEAKNKLEITFDFLTTYGKPYSETLDITDLFFTKEAIENQWLLIDHTIVIPDPPSVGGGGGLQPDVEDWGDIETDIII